jgi:hypothetical protein
MQDAEDTPRWTTRAAAYAVACPHCGAAPGAHCTGADGTVRKSAHQPRHQVALAAGAPVAKGRVHPPRRSERRKTR